MRLCVLSCTTALLSFMTLSGATAETWLRKGDPAPLHHAEKSKNDAWHEKGVKQPPVQNPAPTISMDQALWLARDVVTKQKRIWDPKADRMVYQDEDPINPTDKEYQWLKEHAEQYAKDETTKDAEVRTGTAEDHVLDHTASVRYEPK